MRKEKAVPLELKEGERECFHCDGEGEWEHLGELCSCQWCDGRGYLGEHSNPIAIDLERQRREQAYSEQRKRFIAAMYRRRCNWRGVWYRHYEQPCYYLTWLRNGSTIHL